MLHILLIILKIIGWVILAILGLVVLLICLVLFTPFRYQIRACCSGTLETLNAEMKFSLFLHLISGQIQYIDGNMHWNIRAAWKKITSEKTEENEEESSTDINTERADADLQVERKAEVKEPDISVEKESVELSKQKKLSGTEPQNTESIFKKIKYTFRTFCDKINALLRKKEILMDFVKDEVHQDTVVKALKELKRLLLRLKPEKISGMIHFGFEDPSLTGYVLAGVSMVYPLTSEHLEVQPDFEQKVLEGSLYVKGHVRAVGFASFALRMIVNRNVRTTIRDIKNFSFDA